MENLDIFARTRGMESFLSEIFTNIEPEDACLIWCGPVDQEGIGIITIDAPHEKNKTRKCIVHIPQLLWSLSWGDSDKHTELKNREQICGRNACCNISHWKSSPLRGFVPEEMEEDEWYGLTDQQFSDKMEEKRQLRLQIKNSRL